MEIEYPGFKIHRRTKYSKPSLEFLFNNSSNEFSIPDVNKCLEDFNKCSDFESLFFDKKPSTTLIINGFIADALIEYLFIPRTSNHILSDTDYALIAPSFKNLYTVFFPENIEYVKCFQSFKNTGMKFLYLPANIKSIDGTYFSENKNLEQVVIDAKLEKIPHNCFERNNSLKNILLNDSIKYIEVSAFKDCTRLKQINLPLNLKIIGESAFENSGLESIVIPENVDTIYEKAFCHTQINEVFIPKNVKLICRNAFNTKYLKAVTIENIDVLTLEHCAFNSKDTLTVKILEKDQNKIKKWIKENKESFNEDTIFISENGEIINNKPSLDNIIASFKNETHKIIENIQGNER